MSLPRSGFGMLLGWELARDWRENKGAWGEISCEASAVCVLEGWGLRGKWRRDVSALVQLPQVTEES